MAMFSVLTDAKREATAVDKIEPRRFSSRIISLGQIELIARIVSLKFVELLIFSTDIVSGEERSSQQRAVSRARFADKDTTTCPDLINFGCEDWSDLDPYWRDFLLTPTGVHFAVASESRCGDTVGAKPEECDNWVSRFRLECHIWGGEAWCGLEK